MSLRLRLLVTVGTVVAATVALVASLSWWFAAREIREPTDSLLEDRLELLVDAAADAGVDATTSGRTLDTIRATFDLELLARELFLQYLDRAGSPVSEVVIPVTEADRAVARGERDGPVRRNVVVDGAELRVMTVEMPGGAVTLAEDVSEAEQAVEDLGERLVILGAVGVAVAALVAVVVARRIAGPVARVADAAEQLAAGRDTPDRIDVGGRDEIGRLADSFNRMVDALEVSREQQRRLVTDAGHELRTPLTSLRMKIEHLRRNPELDADVRQGLLDDAVAEFEALSDLVTELVVLATDSGDVTEEPVTTHLGDLVRRTAARAASRTGRTVDVEATDADVRVRPRLFERAVSNLLDNAHKYSPETEPLRVVACVGRVEVHDRGPGIAPEERGRVFDRFYRGPHARNRSGSGIGLAIVRRVAELHGGTAFVDTSPDGGAVVGFTFATDDRPPGRGADAAQ